MGNPRTRVRGQRIHRDPLCNYSFWRPLNWQQAGLATEHSVVYYPEEDPRTGFYVSVSDLDTETPISEEDLPGLREGLREGLLSLPECKILSDQQITKEQALGFDFLVTFSLDGDRCKRRLRILYLQRRQYTIFGQGVPPEEYDVFKNVFDYMYLTFTFRDLTLDMGVPAMPDFSPTGSMPTV